MHVNKHIYKPARIVVSSLAGFFITINGRWEQIAEALFSPLFYVAILVSYCICYLLLYYIHFISIKLDRILPWERNVPFRLGLQILLGVCIPILLDIALAGLFIGAQGRTLHNSGFLDRDLPYIIAFLLLVNAFYPVNYYLKFAPKQHDSKEAISGANKIVIRHYNTLVTLDAEHDVFCVVKAGRPVSVITMNGDEHSVKESLQTLSEKLIHPKYQRINRSTIINIETIAGFTNGEKRNTLELILKPPFHEFVSANKASFFIVTAEHIPNLRLLIAEN